MQSEQPKYRIAMTVAACLWLGLFPLLQGGTYAHITHDKWIIMLCLTGMTLICFCTDLTIGLIARRRRAVRLLPFPVRSPLAWLPLIIASALMFQTAVSCLFSGARAETFLIGSSARYEGFVSQFCYYALFCFFFFSHVRLKPVLLSAAAGATAFFVIVMLQRAGGNPFGLYPSGRSYAQNPEFQGTIGNVDMGTGYLLILAALFLYGLVSAVSGTRNAGGNRPEQGKAKPGRLIMRILYLVCLSAALLITLYLIVTMDVQFGAISLAVLTVFTILRFLPIPKWFRLPLLILLIIIVLLVVWLWPGHGGGVWELHEIFHGRSRMSFGSNRVAVWIYSLGLARENLLFGGGSGSFVTRFNQYLSDHGLVIPDEQDGKRLPNYFDNPHNEYIQQLTDHGLPAMLLFLALLLFAVFRHCKAGFPFLAPCSAAVLCYAVQAFFSFSVCLVAPMFWVILALSSHDNSSL